MIYSLVHGFVKAEYDAIEGDRLEVLFQLNVKGETATNTQSISGTITQAGGTASKLYRLTAQRFSLILWFCH